MHSVTYFGEPRPCAVAVLCVAALVCGAVAPARAEVVYSNFGPGMSFDTIWESGWKIYSHNEQRGHWSVPRPWWVWYAQGISHRFTPAVSADFTSAQLALLLDHPELGAWVYVQEAGADGLPGPVLEEIWVHGMPSTGVHRATSVLRPRLKAGVAYWLTVLPMPRSRYPSCRNSYYPDLPPNCGESSVRWGQNTVGEPVADDVAACGLWADYWGRPLGSWWPTARGAFQVNGDTAVTVGIDIKPGGTPNSINPRSNGVIAVGILSSDTFDVATVDPGTVRFGRTGIEAAPAQFALENLDGDGYVDMILHFRTQDTGIACGTTAATLTGMTRAGQKFRGTDSLETTGCK